MYDDSSRWREYAACLGTDPDLFFPVSESGPSGGQIWRAKQVCHSCPVRLDCLAWALRHGVADGIWGGRTATERRSLLPIQVGRKRPLEAACGLLRTSAWQRA
jgi:WhiB family transcriptional regulator, redox-sensing transcriptional regulator